MSDARLSDARQMAIGKTFNKVYSFNSERVYIINHRISKKQHSKSENSKNKYDCFGGGKKIKHPCFILRNQALDKNEISIISIKISIKMSLNGMAAAELDPTTWLYTVTRDGRLVNDWLPASAHTASGQSLLVLGNTKKCTLGNTKKCTSCNGVEKLLKKLLKELNGLKKKYIQLKEENQTLLEESQRPNEAELDYSGYIGYPYPFSESDYL